MESSQSMAAGPSAHYTTGQAGLDDEFVSRAMEGPRPTLDGFDLADDFNPYARTLLADCPKPRQRDTCKSKSVKDVPSEISFKDISCKV